ncbi:MAG: hypothetical protein EPN55_11515 [Gammaproteobacteria bacterium]|nr:MAG: hypothetical protein EPN55_11515 [Gammaproteobacteria bacterium]
MNHDTIVIQAPTLSLAATNLVAMDYMPRDQEQSRRLHEPTCMINSIDPITGHDIGNVTGHPHLTDGILTVYFIAQLVRQRHPEAEANGIGWTSRALGL